MADDTRRQRKRNQVREEFLDVARDVLVEDGWGRFEMQRIASKAGVTTPALYYYFASKDVLLFELVVMENLAVAEAVNYSVSRTENAADAVEAMIRTFVDFFSDRLEMFQLAMLYPPFGNTELMPPGGIEQLRPMNDLLYGGVERRIRLDQMRGVAPDCDPRRTSFTILMGAIGFLASRALVESFGDPLIHAEADVVDDLVRIHRNAVRIDGQG